VFAFFKKSLRRQGWIFAGRLSAEKGIISLIQSWPSHEKLDVAGDGPLLNQIIEYNVYQDLLNKDQKDTGDTWNVHHLKLLKQLINENKEKK
jgi:glycosyltransferase involved in cell wall biosynthesis